MPRHPRGRTSPRRWIRIGDCYETRSPGLRLPSPLLWEFLQREISHGVQLNAQHINRRTSIRQRNIPCVYTYEGRTLSRRNGWAAPLPLAPAHGSKGLHHLFRLKSRLTGRGHAFETPLHFHMGAKSFPTSSRWRAIEQSRAVRGCESHRVWGLRLRRIHYASRHVLKQRMISRGFCGWPGPTGAYYDYIYTERYSRLPSKT